MLLLLFNCPWRFKKILHVCTTNWAKLFPHLSPDIHSHRVIQLNIAHGIWLWICLLRFIRITDDSMWGPVSGLWLADWPQAGLWLAASPWDPSLRCDCGRLRLGPGAAWCILIGALSSPTTAQSAPAQSGVKTQWKLNNQKSICIKITIQGLNSASVKLLTLWSEGRYLVNRAWPINYFFPRCAQVTSVLLWFETND